jgi:hypothetical protein
MNLDINQGSQSLMTLVGRLKCANTCFMYSVAVSSAVMSSLQVLRLRQKDLVSAVMTTRAESRISHGLFVDSELAY